MSPFHWNARVDWRNAWQWARISRGHSRTDAANEVYLGSHPLDRDLDPWDEQTRHFEVRRDYPTKAFRALRKKVLGAYLAKRNMAVSNSDAGMFEALMGSARKPR